MLARKHLLVVIHQAEVQLLQARQLRDGRQLRGGDAAPIALQPPGWSAAPGRQAAAAAAACHQRSPGSPGRRACWQLPAREEGAQQRVCFRSIAGPRLHLPLAGQLQHDVPRLAGSQQALQLAARSAAAGRTPCHPVDDRGQVQGPGLARGGSGERVRRRRSRADRSRRSTVRRTWRASGGRPAQSTVMACAGTVRRRAARWREGGRAAKRMWTMEARHVGPPRPSAQRRDRWCGPTRCRMTASAGEPCSSTKRPGSSLPCCSTPFPGRRHRYHRRAAADLVRPAARAAPAPASLPRPQEKRPQARPLPARRIERQ
jgi:hypothetical protein